MLSGDATDFENAAVTHIERGDKVTDDVLIDLPGWLTLNRTEYPFGAEYAFTIGDDTQPSEFFEVLANYVPLGSAIVSLRQTDTLGDVAGEYTVTFWVDRKSDPLS